MEFYNYYKEISFKIRKNTFKLIGILSTVIALITGGQQLYVYYFYKPDVPVFTGFIYVTLPKDNIEFEQFLESNDGRTVFLDTTLDMSLWNAEQIEYEDKYHILGNIEGSEFSFPMPHQYQKIKIHLLNNRELIVSHGGTGVNMAQLKGAFDINFRVYGALSEYILKEVNIPFEEKVKIENYTK